jgi:hypothetical protein
MTAEVAIMNTRGIAMAADSAVTLGGSGKIYNSADKLFALSKNHPVGIMIYGSAGIMGVAWEIIIKDYRDYLGSKSFDKLIKYKTDFIKYLSGYPYFSKKNIIDYLESRCFDVFSRVLTRFLEDLRAEFKDRGRIKLSEINSRFNTTLKNLKEKLKKFENQKQIKPFLGFINSNQRTINKMIKIVFEKYKLSKKQTAELTNILKLDFQKCVFIDDYTGIVIAGYGEKEIFPVLCSFQVSGKLGNSLICFENEIAQLDTNCSATIRPFAQTEIVQQFVRGVDLNFLDTINEKVAAIMDSLSPLINDPDKKKINAISELLEDYLNKISDIVFKDPILDIVERMEKSELVSMAEAMVNLTALKRHISEDEESVGGPIDVALITKGDGFIWIKKKTNYDPHLNIELKQNYFRR